MRALRERYRDDSASLTKKRSGPELIIGCTYKFKVFLASFIYTDCGREDESAWVVATANVTYVLIGLA